MKNTLLKSIMYTAFIALIIVVTVFITLRFTNLPHENSGNGVKSSQSNFDNVLRGLLGEQQQIGQPDNNDSPPTSIAELKRDDDNVPIALLNLEPPMEGCSVEKDFVVVSDTAYSGVSDVVAGIRVKSLDEKTFAVADSSLRLITLDASSLSMVDASWLPMFLQRGRVLSVEYNVCGMSGSHSSAINLWAFRDPSFKKTKNIKQKNDDKMTEDEMSRLKDQLQKCWKVSEEAMDAPNMVIEMKINVNRDRSVRSAEVVDYNRYINDSFFASVADSARRALYDHHCSFLNLPEQKYDVWKAIRIRFDPADSKGE